MMPAAPKTFVFADFASLALAGAGISWGDIVREHWHVLLVLVLIQTLVTTGTIHLIRRLRQSRASGSLHVAEHLFRPMPGQMRGGEARIAPTEAGDSVIILGDITERRQRENAMREDLEAARAVAQAQQDLRTQLGAAVTLAQALPLCLGVAVRAAGADSGVLFLVDRDSGDLVAAERTGPQREPASEARLPADSEIALRIKAGRPVYAQDPKAPDAVQENCCGVLRALGIVPLSHEGSVTGCLAVASQTLSRIPPVGRAALETVAAQIGSAIPRIRDKEALAASQRQLEAVFDSLNDLLLIVDSQGRILDANAAVAERLGYKREELLGMHVGELHPPAHRSELEGMASGILRGDVKFFSVPMLARDGTLIPLETKLSLGIWDGQKVVIGLARDLTERLRAEAQVQASLREKTALLQEIHHRVKNNLQIISSLLNLQASQLERREEHRLFRESQARVQAMALLHEKLYQSRNFSEIDFGTYLEALARDILRSYGNVSGAISLRTEMDALRVSPDTAMPCGLIVNELITNSCKYAFPGGEPGEICLSVKHLPDHTVVLSLGDNGVGLPPGLDFRTSPTLGLQLVDDLVSQLNGSWTVESSAGTVFRIAFPEAQNRAQEGSQACLVS